MKRYRIFLKILITLCIISACPPLYAFEVTDIIFTAQEPTGCTAPPDHPQPFTIYDRVYTWIDWHGYKAGSTYRYEWYDPDGNLAKSWEKTRTSDSNGCSWASISAQTLWENGGGQWTVKFLYNGTVHCTGTFTFQPPETLGDYMVYKPDSFSAGNGILITVHGTDRSVISYYHFFKDMAERHGVILLVPHFSEAEWHGYQTVFNSEFRADTHLQNMIEAVASEHNADKTKLYLYGHSGGGQFAHRYMMAHPEHISRIVISAPGWWTFPRHDWRYAYGLQKTDDVPDDIQFDLNKISDVKKKVLVGRLDTKRDYSLNISETADIQGMNRLERSAHWVNRMNLLAFASGRDSTTDYEIIPDAGHQDTRTKSGEHIENFLFGDWQTPRTVGTVQISNDADETASRNVRLCFKCRSDSGCGPLAVHTSPDFAHYQDVTWNGIPGQIQTAEIDYALSDGEGTKFVFAQIMSQDGEKGDVFGDAILFSQPDVTIAHAVSALKILTGSNTDTDLDIEINGDGKIGLEEVVYILQKVCGIR